jgi:hypothetical protein
MATHHVLELGTLASIDCHGGGAAPAVKRKPVQNPHGKRPEPSLRNEADGKIWSVLATAARKAAAPMTLPKGGIPSGSVSLEKRPGITHALLFVALGAGMDAAGLT